MGEKNNHEESSTQLSAWDKFRGFVKSNKGKIIGVFTAIVAYLAGDGTVSAAIQAIWNAIFGG